MVHKKMEETDADLGYIKRSEKTSWACPEDESVH